MTDIERAARAAANNSWKASFVGRANAIEDFVTGAEWLAEYLLSDENVEKAGTAIRAELRPERANDGPLYYDHDVHEYMNMARAALSAVLGKEPSEGPGQPGKNEGERAGLVGCGSLMSSSSPLSDEQDSLAKDIAPWIRGWLEEAGQSEDVIVGLSEDIAGALQASGYHKVAERPAECCGKCPPIVGGGYDCTCAENPRCSANSPEWEYGLRYFSEDSERYEDTEMREDRARAVVEAYPCNYKLLRRRKVDDWEVVE